MSRTLHLFGTDWCAMMVPIQVIRWYRMQCYDGTDSCATVVPIRRYCQKFNCMDEVPDMMDCFKRLQGVSFMQWLKDFHHSDSVLLWNKKDMKPALVYWGRRFIYFPIHKIQKILGFKK